MFSDTEILAIKNFTQYIIEKPVAIEAQKHERRGIYLFCEEWEAIEILKVLIHTEPVYLGDPPPNRLKNNPLFDQADIIRKAKTMMRFFEDCRNSSPEIKEIFVNGGGRGIGVLMAHLARPWDSIIVYEPNKAFMEGICVYFGARLELPIKVAEEAPHGV